MKLYVDNKFSLINKYSYSVEDLNKHHSKQEKIINKKAFSDGVCRIFNSHETSMIKNSCTGADRKIYKASPDNDISMNHNDMLIGEKNSLTFSDLIKSIKSIASIPTTFLSNLFASSTKIENKISNTKIERNTLENKIKNASSNLTRLIDCALDNESFLTKEGIFRESSTQTAKKRVQEVLNSNNDGQMTALLKEPDAPNAIAAKIKENLELALSNTHKRDLHKMCVVYDLAAVNDKKEFLPKTSELPLPLQKLMPLLAKTADNAKENLMDATNLAIVIMPRIQPERAVNHAIPITEIMENEKTKIAAYKSFLSDLINDYGK